MKFQEETADCGLACIAMVASSKGMDYELSALKSRFKTSASGSSLMELAAISSSIGLAPRAIRIDLVDLHQVTLPCVLHWGFNHFVVLAGMKGDRFTIYDPAVGRSELSREQLDKLFTGIAVEFEATGDMEKIQLLHRLTIWDLLSAAPKSKRRIIYCLTLSLTTMGGIIAIPLFIKSVIEFSLYPHNTTALFVSTAIASFFVTSFSAVSYIKREYAQRLALDVDFAFSHFLSELLMSTSFDYFIRKTPGMLARYFQDLRTVRRLVSEGLIDALTELVSVGAVIAMTFFIRFEFGLLLAFSTGLYFMIVFLTQRGRIEESRKAAAIENQENLALMDNLRNIQAIKLNGMELARSELWRVAYRRATTSLEKLNNQTAAVELLGGGYLAVLRCILIAAAALLVLQSDLTSTEFLSLALFQTVLTYSIANLSKRILVIWDVKGVLQDINSLMAAERDPMAAPRKVEPHLADRTPVDTQLAGKTVLECTELAYRFDATNPRVFRDTSFTVDVGDIVAITGPSGCGKSTLLRVLTGLLEHESGELNWFGRPIQGWTRSELVRHVGCVMQEDQVFTGTLQKNICRFELEVDQERLLGACHAVGLSDLIQKMPMGMHTPVSANSTLLSQGEKQRVFLARALYSRAEVLLLDEFTGNLDSKLEELIFDELKAMGATIIMTAHRESTIGQANKVLEYSLPTKRFSTRST